MSSETLLRPASRRISRSDLASVTARRIVRHAAHFAAALASTDGAPIAALHSDGRIAAVNDHWSAIDRPAGLLAPGLTIGTNLLHAWGERLPDAVAIDAVTALDEVLESSDAHRTLDYIAGNGVQPTHYRLHMLQWPGTPPGAIVVIQHERTPSASESTPCRHPGSPGCTVFHASTEGGCVLTPQGRIVAANRRFASLLGCAPPELVGHSFASLHAGAEITPLDGSAPPREVALKHRSGHSIRVIPHATVLSPQDGPHGLYVTIREVTEQSRIVEALRDSDSWRRDLIHALSDWVWEVDTEGVYTYASPRVRELLGYEVEEVIGRSFVDFLDVDEVGPMREAFQQIVSRAAPIVNLLNTCRHRAGHRVIVETSGVPVFSEDGRLRGYRGLDRDVTQRERMQQALRESQADYERIIETMREGICVVNRHWRITYANARLAEMLGYTADQLVDRHIREFVAPVEQASVMAWTQSDDAARREAFDLRLVNSDGKTVWTVVASKPISDAQGQFHGLIAMLTDVTERRKAEEALRQSEERFRVVVENAQDLALMLDLEGRFTYASPSIHRLLGYTQEEVVGRHLAGFVHPEDVVEFHGAFAQVAWDEVPSIEMLHRLQTHDGRYRYFQSIAARIASGAGLEGVIVNGRDVTEQHQAQEEARNSFRRISALHEMEAIIGASRDLTVTLRLLATHAVALLGIDTAVVLLSNDYAPTLDYVAGVGAFVAARRRMPVQIDGDIAGKALIERRACLIGDLRRLESHSHATQRLADAGAVSYAAFPLLSNGEALGVLEIIGRTVLDADYEWTDLAESLCRQATIAIDNARLFGNLQRTNLELSLAHDATIEALARALEFRDRETEGHTRRVTDMTLRLAMAMGVPEADIVHIRRGALLHDIGKMSVPDSILLKPGPLTPEEMQIMRQHTDYARDILHPIPFLSDATDIPYGHHEKWDGTGYPQGLRAGEIPLAARLFAIVDVWDALMHERPYKPAWPRDRVREHLLAQSGAHFDPAIVTAFLAVEERWWEEHTLNEAHPAHSEPSAEAPKA